MPHNAHELAAILRPHGVPADGGRPPLVEYLNAVAIDNDNILTLLLRKSQR